MSTAPASILSDRHTEFRQSPAEPAAQSAASDVSVIIPTCDRPDYVREAIASALAQTARPHEILVIDNGVRELSLKGLPPEVKLHRIAPRVGPSRARNFGAAVATGTYLAFLDDDDWWEPNFLANVRATVDRENVRCVYGRKDLSVSGRLSVYRIPSKDVLTVPVLLRRNPGTGGMNLLIERMLFLKIGGFDERLRLSEDRALAIELILAGEPIGVAPAAVAIVRMHTSNRLRQRHIRKMRFVLKYRHLYPKLELVSSVARIAAISLLAHVANGSARLGRFITRLESDRRMEFEELSTKYLGSTAANYVKNRIDAKWLAENAAAEALLTHIPQRARVLDAPVGTARLAPFFKVRDFDAHGLDVSPDMLAQARSYAARIGADIRLNEADIRRIPYPDEHFDLVTCVRFMNWVDEQGMREVMKELARVSRDKMLVGVRYLLPFSDLGSGVGGLIRRAMRLIGLSRYSAARSSLTNHDRSFLDALFRELRLEIFDVRQIECRWDGTDYAFFLLQKGGRN